jgi:hypothetical protein
MEKVQNPVISVCYTPSSEHYKFYWVVCFVVMIPDFLRYFNFIYKSVIISRLKLSIWFNYFIKTVIYCIVFDAFGEANKNC